MIDDKNYQTLEFDKILTMLAHEAGSKKGKELCLDLKPSIFLFEANEMLNQTKTAFSLVSKFGLPCFSSIEDIEESVSRAKAGGMLNTKELIKISKTLNAFKALKNWKKQDSSKTVLDNFFEAITPNKQLEEKINRCIISENEIADRASQQLYSIRRQKLAKQDEIKQRLNKMTRSPSFTKYLQESIVTVRDGRYVLPVKAEFKGNIAGLVHDSSASGSTLFIEPIAVVKANNEIKELNSKEKVEIDKILFSLSGEVAGFAHDIFLSLKMAFELDVIFAKASLAFKMSATAPKLNDIGKINLKKARHPLIDKEKVVPIDVNLGIDFEALIITGPNTGGKTVTLKTVGLLTLMAMSGMLIPANDGSEVSIFTYILTDIGDEQSIEQSLSTFSSHMKNIINILNKANERSLILLDELGSGTDPVEGAALAMAIIEKLLNRQSKIITTTHYSELKAFALKNNKTENASCEFDIKTLKPTYNLLIGLPGRSNAFDISKKLGLDEDIIDNAKGKISSKDHKFEDVIKTMEENIKRLKDKQNQCDLLIKENEKLKLENQTKKEKLLKEVSIEVKEQREKAKNIVERSLEQSADLLDKLNYLIKNKDKIKPQTKAEINKKIKNLQNEFDPVVENKANDQEKPAKPFEAGDSVLIIDINSKAQILKLEGKDIALVKAGNLKTRVKLNNLRHAQKSKAVKSATYFTSANISGAGPALKMKLDLRGKIVEEALIKLDKFIDNAVLNNLKSVTILHGKGSGKLRSAVHKYLKENKYVKTFRLGDFGEGDTGVTVVQIYN